IEPPIEVLQTSALPLGYRAAYPPQRVQTRHSPGMPVCEKPSPGLRGRQIWSGRRDLNPRLRPWQGRTLPLSYSRSADLDYSGGANNGANAAFSGWLALF